MKVFTIIIMIFLCFDSYSQVDSILIKTYYSDNSTPYEEYVISKKDSMKNGSFKKFTAKGKVYVNGMYRNNFRTGIWEFYNKYSGYTELIEKYDYTNNHEIYYKNLIDVPAHFIGGEEEFNEYILSSKSLDSIKNISGKIQIGLTVDTLGNLINITIYRGLRTDIDNLLISMLKDSPKWIPATKNGVKINETFVLPIEIKK